MIICIIAALFTLNSFALIVWVCLTERRIQKWEREK